MVFKTHKSIFINGKKKATDLCDTGFWKFCFHKWVSHQWYSTPRKYESKLGLGRTGLSIKNSKIKFEMNTNIVLVFHGFVVFNYFALKKFTDLFSLCQVKTWEQTTLKFIIIYISTLLLKYNWYTINCIYLKCIIWQSWTDNFNVYIYSYYYESKY